MDLHELFQRLFHEQQWREQQASQMGNQNIPQEVMPFNQGMQQNMPGLFEMLQRRQDWLDKQNQQYKGIPPGIIEKLMMNFPKRGWQSDTDLLNQQPL
jgi:hypothetical protein